MWWCRRGGEEAGPDADVDLEVDGAEAGVLDVDLAAGHADAVHEVGELGALVPGDGVGVDGVGGDGQGVFWNRPQSSYCESMP